MVSADFIFGTREHINAWQECARTLVILTYGLFLIRVLGRRVFGKWSALDFVVAIIAGSSLSRALTGSAPLGGTMAAVGLLMVVHWALAHMAARHKLFSWLVEGRAVTLGQSGNIDVHKMKSNNITKADLDEQLREKDVEEVSKTKLVTLEPSGKITVVKS